MLFCRAQWSRRLPATTRVTYGHRKGAMLASYAVAKGQTNAGARLEVLQGTLDLMVLQTLDSMGPQHGYGIARRIEQVSEDILTLNEGTVYAALMRLQHRRWISASWGASENNRKAKFYAITAAGRRQLAREVETWDRLAGLIARLRGAEQRLTCGLRLRARVSRLFFVLTRRRLDEDARLEIDAHLDLLTERYLRQGMSPDDAYIAARRQFRQYHPHASGHPRHEQHRMDRAGRSGSSLRAPAVPRQRRFCRVVVATLGLGIGGATAVFSVVQAVLLAPLPYEEPGQLVRFYQQEPDKPDTRGVLAGTHFTFLRDHATVVRGRRRDRELSGDRAGSLHRRPRRAPPRPARVERLLQRAPLAAPAWPRLRSRR